MEKRPLGKSGLLIAPLVFGGNVFGWTADQSASFRLLDAFVDKGFNLIDTANIYSTWVPGHQGGESETIIGNWLKKSGKREKVLIATKVGMAMGTGEKGLKKKYIFKAVEESLTRLQTDVIDLYQTHIDDPETSVGETLEALSELVKLGKVRAIGASQYSAARLKESLKVTPTSYTCLQPLYNLYDRENFEKNLAPICREYGLGVISFYSLASGFLSGKYRKESDLAGKARGTRVQQSYFNEKGLKIVKALDLVSKKMNAPISSISLAWILSNPLVTAPIASATSVEQLSELALAPDIKLDQESLKILNEASA